MNRRRTATKQFVPGGVHNTPKQHQSNTKQQQQQSEVAPPINQPAQQEYVERNDYEQQEAEPVEAAYISETEEKQEDGDDPMAGGKKGGKLKFKKIFLKRKKSSVRIKEKKIRQNRQLRKALLPKNALMALNEVKGVVISDFVINNSVSGGFTAAVTVNDKPYEGKGSNKMAAKNNACERALRDYVIAKMLQKPRLQKNQAGSSEAMDTTEANNDEESSNTTGNEDADDVPMINLASFAIYKLFTEWENEGFVIPEFHPAAVQPKNNIETDGAPPKEATKRHELPPNWETIHPATLLCMMRPGINYINYDPIGEKPNALQRIGVFVDDQEFIGKGRSKKSARRNAAVEVCNTLFSTNFELDSIINPNAATTPATTTEVAE